MQWKLALVALVTMTGCFSPTFHEGLPCTAEGRRCPGDQVCADDDRCYSPGGAPLPDAAVLEDGAPRPDATQEAAPHEFIYANEMLVNVNGVFGVLLIANTSDSRMTTDTLTVVSIADDLPDHTVTVDMSPEPSSLEIFPTAVAGGQETDLDLIEALEAAEDTELFDGLVRVRTDHGYMAVQIPTFFATQDTFDMNIEIVIELNGIQTTLPFLIHHTAGPIIRKRSAA